MKVHLEASGRTDARLRRLITLSDLTVLPGSWWLDEVASTDFDTRVRSDALALVRDDDTWSQLVPVRASDAVTGDRLRVWSFHFPPTLDNSGFVGWLASHIKGATGSGVLVVCGRNSARGGIYDYWACPDTVGDQVCALIRELMHWAPAAAADA